MNPKLGLRQVWHQPSIDGVDAMDAMESMTWETCPGNRVQKTKQHLQISGGSALRVVGARYKPPGQFSVSDVARR
ncbi:MAG: hypothetical protein KME20_20230 [Kaiparowitsia implicata GSE-PSE-MK54-09C]|nr:hypothetical protein [Kaiparowitsia implicata GSE-PSE-MK54-09C]